MALKGFFRELFVGVYRPLIVHFVSQGEKHFNRAKGTLGDQRCNLPRK